MNVKLRECSVPRGRRLYTIQYRILARIKYFRIFASVKARYLPRAAEIICYKTEQNKAKQISLSVCDHQVETMRSPKQFNQGQYFYKSIR